MPVLAIEVRVCLLDFWDLISPVEPIGRHESQFAGGLDRAVVAAVLDLVNLLSQSTDLVLDFFVASIIALLVLPSHEMILLTLFIGDPVAPLLLQASLDFLRAEVLYLLLDRVKMLVLKDLVGCLRLLWQGAAAELEFELLDLGLLGRSELLQGERLGAEVLVA